MLLRTLSICVLVLCTVVPATAGGPAYVAGAGFDPATKGQTIIWAGGNLQYFTDQGDLSPILTGEQADVLVADVFTHWTTIPSAAVSATFAGHLAEDVSSANVIGFPDGTYSIPDDIQPAAVATPLGIVYDVDGTVTDALLGAGAGSQDFCFNNAVYGGPDDFSFDAHLVHALVVINGVSVADTSKLPDVRYRLTRTLGRVLGLGWAQANLNVITRNPIPAPDDFQGFPVMHFLDPIACVPINICYPDAEVPKMDDRAAMARLYPANASTARIHGSVFFTDAAGNAAQPMQGLDVVARRIESGQPSRRFVATSVSGFTFRGNAGNTVNGFVDVKGLPFDYFGSNDLAVEGTFELAGLEIPNGSSAQYQLSVESLDANWSEGVRPYAPAQVASSGSFTPVVITVQPGSDIAQDVLMRASAIAQVDRASGSSYANPVNLPQGGGWGAWLSGYGVADWLQFTAQGNRTASVTVTALDELGNPTQNKLAPVIGIWPLSDQSGGPAPAATPVAFNTLVPATTRLDAQFTSGGTFRLGVADFRGDGRPDYFYSANVLYSDTITPARVSLRGGPVTLHGFGFHPGLQVTVGSASGTMLSVLANDLQATLPAVNQDGVASVSVNDSASGGFSLMTDAVTYGAASTDLLLLLEGTEPSTPIGAEAANPIRVRVVAADGKTAVDGATVTWSTTNGASLSACGGASSCSVLSDQAGFASTQVTPAATGTSVITAALAPASYTPPQSKTASVMGTASAVDLAAVAPTKWVAQGATIDVPITVRLLDMGAPISGIVINFRVSKGAGSLSSPTGTTGNTGFASTTLHLANHASDVQVTACVAPNNTPCQTFTMFATPASSWRIENVSGTTQVIVAGQPFQAMALRITDSASPANPVMGANLVFDVTIVRIPKDSGGGGGGDDGGGGRGGHGGGSPIILGTYEVKVATADGGIASWVPNVAGVQGYCDLMIALTAGMASSQFDLQVVEPMGGLGGK
ncbi:MAG: Ig-like domain-containing protein [Acidobacteria bacterium]|nr:Ig-like domain-containing protein [Acidobacteriota bacterium]